MLFIYDKEIRIPLNDVQIKCTLTCAKVNVEYGGDMAVPNVSTVTNESPELTEQEKKETADLLASLNL